MGEFGSSLLVWYAIPFLLFVLLYYRYLQSGNDDESVRSPLFDNRRPPANWPESRLRCPACGTTNDPAFSYCRNCVTKISDVSDGTGGSSWLTLR